MEYEDYEADVIESQEDIEVIDNIVVEDSDKDKTQKSDVTVSEKKFLKDTFSYFFL